MSLQTIEKAVGNALMCSENVGKEIQLVKTFQTDQAVPYKSVL
jgi:hypothetical protein